MEETDWRFFWRTADACGQLGIDRFQLVYMSEYIPHIEVTGKKFLWPSEYIVGLGDFLAEGALAYEVGIPLYAQYPAAQGLVFWILEQYEAMISASEAYTNKELSEMFNVGRATINDWVSDGTLVPEMRRVHSTKQFGPRYRDVPHFPQEQVRRIFEWKLPQM